MPLLDIAVRLYNLLQRIDPVYDRLELARLDQFLEHEQVIEHISAVGVGDEIAVDTTRLERQHPVFRQAFVLGMSAKIHPEGRCKNPVACLELPRTAVKDFHQACRLENVCGVQQLLPHA